MNQGHLSQILLDQSHRSMAENSQEKSSAHYSIIQAMLQYKMQEHSIIQPGELINSSIAEDVPHFSERGADYSSKMHDNDNIRYSNQKPNQRMSHVYPSYMSENSVKIDHEKIQMIEHTYSIQQIEKIFKTNLNQGLSEEEASSRLNRYGINRIESKRASVSFDEIINKFTVALFFAILLSVVGYFVDEREHIPFLIEIVSLSIIFVMTHILTYTSYSKRKKLLDEFNQIISTDEVVVIRGGVKQKISSTLLVKGDLIELNSFTKIPADCRIIESQQLSVDNFIFTGESQPLLLESEESNHKSIFEAKNVAFLGVGIVFGEGKAIVVNTGEQTILGKLIKKIEVPQINSYIDQQVKKIIDVTFVIILAFVLLTVIGWFVWEYKAEKYDWTFLINTIIIIILSNLPFTMMLILSYSKRKIAYLMSDQKIILTDINAIENLTQMSLLLVNKESLLLEQQRPKKIILENKTYGIHYIKNQQNMINCIHYCLHSKKQDFIMYDRQNIQNILEQFIKQYPVDQQRVIKQRQFTAMERYSLTIVQNLQNKSQYIVYIMGAPEVISQKLFLRNSFEEIEYMESHKKLAMKGYSLISCASLSLTLDENFKFNVDNTNEFNFYFKNLTNLGTIALKISISPVIKTALQKLQLSGIRVVLMTGDFPQTAHYIAQESNLVANPLIVTGDDLDNPALENDQPISEETDEESINTKLCTQLNTIYARINPAQKLMVIQAYQKLGYKVGLIGFDTIDSPALRKCDISFSFGRSDELAKHSSNVILIGENQQDLEQILRSVYQGRRFTDNLIKQIKLCISNKFGQFIPILFMLFLGFPLPLTSFGILYITLVLDILVVSIVYEKEELDVVIREPSKVKIFVKLQHFLRWILTHGVLAASSGMMSYLVAMQYFGFHNKSLPFIIYKEGYSSQIANSEQYYPYNSSDQYLGNTNLESVSQAIKFNPFITYQFYRHFNHATFDFRNVIVKLIDGNWTTNFDITYSELCKSNTSDLCYSYLSLDIAQLGFIYGFIIWGWFHVFLGRTRILSFRYQTFNKRLMITYIISLIIILMMYLPYMIFYFPDKDLNFFGVIGIPSIPMLLIYFCFSELTAKRKLRKLE